MRGGAKHLVEVTIGYFNPTHRHILISNIFGNDD